MRNDVNQDGNSEQDFLWRASRNSVTAQRHTLCSSMAAAGLQSTDVLHYESRAIRAGLKASINRLTSAKGYIPSSLTPEELRQHGVPQDWSAPKVIVDFEEVRNGLCRGGMQWRVRCYGQCPGRMASALCFAAAMSRGADEKQGVHDWVCAPGSSIGHVHKGCAR